MQDEDEEPAQDEIGTYRENPHRRRVANMTVGPDDRRVAGAGEGAEEDDATIGDSIGRNAARRPEQEDDRADEKRAEHRNRQRHAPEDQEGTGNRSGRFLRFRLPQRPGNY